MIRALRAQLDPGDRRRLDLQVGLIVAYSVLQGVAFVLLVPVLRDLLVGATGGAGRWLAVLAGVVAVTGAVFLAQALLGHRLAGTAARTIHRRLGAHVAALPLGWFGPERVGELARLSSQGVTDVMGVISHLMRPMVAAIVTPLTVVVLMYAIDWRLALATTATIPLIAGAHVLSGRLARRAAGAVQSAAAEAGARIVEFARVQPVLRAFGRVGDRDELLDGALRAQHAARRRQLWTMSGGLLASSVAVQLAFIVVVVLGVNRALDGDIGVPELVALLVLVARFGQPLVEAADIVGAVRVAERSLAGIRAVLAARPLPEPADPREPADASVRLRGVRFSYGDEAVIDGLDLDVPAGTTVALVGPSGAGKTTVTRLVARFWDVDAGSVEVGGVDVREMTAATLMGRVSMVTQSVHLGDGSILENIRSGRPGATDDEVRAAATAACVDEIVERLPDRWDSRVGEGGTSLSGGERQRVSIARALLKDAPIVLLDEATSALDVENEAAVGRALRALGRGRTRIIVAHRLSTIATADRIVVLDGGRVAESGTHEELLARGGRYARLWETRTRARGWRIDGAAARGAGPAGL